MCAASTNSASCTLSRTDCNPSVSTLIVCVCGCRFGGYVCLQSGINSGTGPVCYSNIMYIYNLQTSTWRALEKPTNTSDPQYALWPGPRSYHTMTLHRRKLWVYGGAYVDSALVQFYYVSAYAPSLSCLVLHLHLISVRCAE